MMLLPKMITCFRFPALLLLSIVAHSIAMGQGGDRRRGGDENMPQAGSLIPDITVVDSQGGGFPLREKLKGRHAVIVFGCLT
ncbi:MAG: hypothetical protein VYB61_00460 [Verrucomicrobiota bacterium]|nr:hypothetical protein [Verrucomicrobiota bacterium]